MGYLQSLLVVRSGVVPRETVLCTHFSKLSRAMSYRYRSIIQHDTNVSGITHLLLQSKPRQLAMMQLIASPLIQSVSIWPASSRLVYTQTMSLYLLFLSWSKWTDHEGLLYFQSTLFNLFIFLLLLFFLFKLCLLKLFFANTCEHFRELSIVIGSGSAGVVLYVCVTGETAQ